MRDAAVPVSEQIRVIVVIGFKSALGLYRALGYREALRAPRCHAQRVVCSIRERYHRLSLSFVPSLSSTM